ncbi:tetraacyldisaccharide 4'-kinase [Aquifex sp.]
MPRSKLLFPFIFPYAFGVSVKNFLYDKGIKKPKKLPVPVISVGNLSVGGTGKTSFVVYLANLLKDRRVCILLRGYKRKSRGVVAVSKYGEILTDWERAGDEAYLLAKLLPYACVVVAEDRYEGGLFAIKNFNPELIILDDGFQHRKLHRDLDIVLLKRKDIKDYLLPYGNLREPLSSLKRANVIILSYQEVEPFEFRTEKPAFKMFREFGSLLDSEFREFPIEHLKGKEVIAFSGLGDNEQFLKSLRKLGFRVKEFISFPDHYDYRDFKPKREEIYLTTPKDLIKLRGYENVFALNFQVRIEGGEELKRLIYRTFY